MPYATDRSPILLHRGLRRGLAISCLLVGAAQAGEASAQAGAIDPAQTERAIERLQRNQPHDVPPVLRAPANQSVSTAQRPLFVLQTVRIVGAKTLSPADVAPAYRGLIGKNVSVADLSAMTNRIDETYRAAGYHLSRAIIAPQNADGGKLVVTVIEGQIAEITTRGDAAASTAVRKMLAPLTGEAPSRRNSVERHLLLASDLPGIRIADTSIEEIGQSTGRFRLVIDLQTWDTYSNVAVDNRGTRAVGPYQAFGTTNLNSVLRPGDTVGVALSTTPEQTEELRFGRLTYSTPLGWDGARLSFLGLRSDVRPGDSRRQFDTRDQANFGELRGTIAPIRSRDSSLWLSAGVAAGNYDEGDVLGRIYSDRVRYVLGTIDYQRLDQLGGWNYLTVNARQGFDVFGASVSNDPFLSRRDASGEFSRVDVFYSRIQPIAGQWSLKLAAAGQWSSGSLLASQQSYLGAAFGRGFFGLEISGDRAAAGSAELRFDQTLASDFLKSYQLYGYIDHSTVWNARNDLGAAKLTLAGFGARLVLPDSLLATIELAAPLEYTTPLSQPLSRRLFFGISKAFKLCPGSAQLACG